MTTSDLEESFLTQLRWLNLPEPVREHRFHAIRRWRLDFFWPQYRYAVEIDGGVNGRRGRHIRPAGFREDAIKEANAVLAGIAVMRFPGDMVTDGSAIALVEEYLNARLQSNRQDG